MREKQSFGQTIREFRQGLGLTTRELAERAGLSHPMVVKTERGERRPGFATVLKLTGALGLGEKTREKLLREHFPGKEGKLAELLVLELLREAGFEASRGIRGTGDITAHLGGGLELCMNLDLSRRTKTPR